MPFCIKELINLLYSREYKNALLYITTPDSPEHHTEQYITEQIKACANLVKFVVCKKATKERDIDIYKFVELFEEAISHPSMQIIYSPHLEAIECICRKQIPKDEFQSKVQKYLSESTTPVDQLQLEKHIFDDKELSILKENLWLKLNMPKVDGMNSNTLISNINSNCYLHDIERAKRIKDIQNSHLIEIKKIITERVKVPDFENRKENPADEFIAQFKEYPFKTIKEELVNG